MQTKHNTLEKNLGQNALFKAAQKTFVVFKLLSPLITIICKMPVSWMNLERDTELSRTGHRKTGQL